MNALNDALTMRKELGMKIEEQINPVARILGVVVGTRAELPPVLQTSRESHFEEAVEMGLSFGLKHQQDEGTELQQPWHQLGKRVPR